MLFMARCEDQIWEETLDDLTLGKLTVNVAVQFLELAGNLRGTLTLGCWSYRVNHKLESALIIADMLGHLLRLLSKQRC